MFKRIDKTTNTTQSTQIIASSNGKSFSSTTVTTSLKASSSLFSLFGINEEPNLTIKPLIDHLHNKLKQENLSQKIRDFIKAEIISLQEKSIPEDHLYLTFMNQLGESGFEDTDETFFMSQMIHIRNEKQNSQDTNLQP